MEVVPEKIFPGYVLSRHIYNCTETPLKNNINKISIFIPSLEKGGVERNIVNLSRGFIGQGVSVDIVVYDCHEAFLKQIPPEVSVVKLNTRLFFPSLGGLFPYRVRIAVSLVPRFLKYLNDARPDAVISFQSSISAVLAKTLSRHKPKLIVRESNTASFATAANKHWFSRVVPFLKRLFYPKADKVVAVSKGVADDLIENIGIPEEKVKVIYNPTFNEAALNKANDSLVHPWFDDGQPPVILGVGRLTKQKDFPTLLKAFDLIRRQVPSKLVILGEGEDRKALEQLADRLGISDDVDFHGFVDNPYKYLVRSSVFVLSSIYEGLPNVVIEALALKVPVVSTDCPSGPREILLDGSAGPLVAMGDYRTMAKEVISVLKDRQRSNDFLTKAWEHLWRFRPEEALKQYWEIFETSDNP